MQLALRRFLSTNSAIALSVAVLFLLCLTAGAQSTAPAAPPAQAIPAQGNPVQLTPAQQRSAQLAADTAQLQALAAELKAAMEKSSKDTLSLNVIKKAQEVEKLAHKVRNEMRNSLLAGS
jgi:hypothetical protein